MEVRYLAIDLAVTHQAYILYFEAVRCHFRRCGISIVGENDW
jgi:hypothetical protein